MNEKDLKKIEKLRSIGKKRFIYKYGGFFMGVLGFGIVGQFFLIVSEYIVNDFTFAFLDKNFQIDLFLRFLTAFPTGCIIGWTFWKFNERNYLKAKTKSK